MVAPDGVAMISTDQLDQKFCRIFLSRIDRSDPTGCWPYSGPRRPSRQSAGYAVIAVPGGGTITAHRLSYTLINGPIPPGLVVGHACHDLDLSCPPGSKCRHRICCNPAHLILQTNAQNVRSARTGLRRQVQRELVSA